MVDDEAIPPIAQLIADHHQAVYRYAYRLAGSVADAEDLTQQVFLIAHEKREQVRSPETVRTWLFTVLRNAFLKGCQKRRPIPAGSIDFLLDSIPAQAPPADEIDREKLQQALEELPPQYRVVVSMFYYEDCSYREIAEKLSLPMGTVMSRLARAKALLRSKLFGLSGEQGGGVGQQPRAANSRG
jgi:RNA polymerase sigma-70 factor (ECF subfamily)